MSKIITVLIVTYTLGSFFTTLSDLIALKSVQAATVQPIHRGNR